MIDGPLHCAAKIVVLGLESLEPEAALGTADVLIGIAREAIRPLGESGEELVVLFGSGELLQGKGAYDLQHAVTSIRFGVLRGLEQAVFDEDRHGVEDVDPG